MKKFIAALSTILLIVSLSIPAFADDISWKNDVLNESIKIGTEDLLPSTEHFTIDEIMMAEDSATERSAAPYATQYFSFGTMEPNSIISDFVEYEIQAGETAFLTINSCLWSPHTCDIRIGIYDLDTGYAWYYTFSGGSCSGTYTFSNLPEGRYMVYVRNIGSKNITSGSIRYSLV